MLDRLERGLFGPTQMTRSGFQAGDFDVRERLSPVLPAWASQIVFALFCLGLLAIVRFGIDLAAPGAAPFSLMYPAALLATLYAGWQSGAMVAALSQVFAWYFVLNNPPSFAHGDAALQIVVAASTVATIAVAETFRRGANGAVTTCRKQNEEKELLLQEVDHRVRNNFTVVASLVDMQRRRATDESTKAALTEVLARIEGVGRAHRHLYADGDVGDVSMQSYLGGLCEALAESLSLHGAFAIESAIAEVSLPRDRAVSIGMIVNELVTNAAKHAFGDRHDGLIAVRFTRDPEGYLLMVEDNGSGMPETPKTAGLGKTLLQAFARQAGGVLETRSGPEGTRVSVRFQF